MEQIADLLIKSPVNVLFHSNEINKSSAIPSNRLYKNATKYGHKVIQFGDSRLGILIENDSVITYQKVDAA